MSHFYRPVLIESAEQAEQLPDGAMAYIDGVDAYGAPSRSVAVKHRGVWWVDDREDDVVGWTALVPLEAEEETWDPGNPPGSRIRAPRPQSTPARRLVTPWEEA